MKNYDPNIQHATHSIDVTFQCWEAKRVERVSINGNCKGSRIIKAAFETAAEKLAEIIEKTGGVCLTGPSGEKLEIDDSDIDELEKLIVGVVIVSHEKEQGRKIEVSVKDANGTYTARACKSSASSTAGPEFAVKALLKKLSITNYEVNQSETDSTKWLVIEAAP